MPLWERRDQSELIGGRDFGERAGQLESVMTDARQRGSERERVNSNEHRLSECERGAVTDGTINQMNSRVSAEASMSGDSILFSILS